MIDFDWMVALGMLRGILAMVGAFMLTAEALSAVAFLGVCHIRASRQTPADRITFRPGIGACGAALLALCWALGMVGP